jgi:hypothetical protein
MDETAPKFDKTNVSTYSKSSKNIDALSGKKIIAFPSTLGSTTKDEVGNDFSYIIIRINTVESGSKLKEDAGTGAVLVADKAVQTGAAFDVGKVGATVGTKNQADKDLVSRYGPAATSAENKVGWTKKVGLTKLDKVIVLPMPANYSVDTKITYDESETGDVSKAIDFASSVGSSSGAAAYLGMAAANIGAAALSGIVDKLKKSVGAETGPDNMKTKLLAMGKVAVNQKKEVLFKDIGFRNFTFSYMLSPKNSYESTIIQEIILTLRYYALPELNPNKLFYTFPAEFEIALMKGAKENTAIPKIATCVLENVDVQYSSGGGTWGIMPDGMPPMVSLNLAFKELELIDRTRVWNKDSVITSGY